MDCHNSEKKIPFPYFTHYAMKGFNPEGAVIKTTRE